MPCVVTAELSLRLQDAADAVHVLVEAQPWSLNCRDARGRSAAHWAAVRGASDALEALVARGADVRSRDADGQTAGELLPTITRPPVLRQWEAERKGAAGEYRWDYAAVMEATMFRHDAGRSSQAPWSHPDACAPALQVHEESVRRAALAQRRVRAAVRRVQGAPRCGCCLRAVPHAARAAVLVRRAALQRLPRGVLLRLGLPTPRLDVGGPPPGVRGRAAAAGAPDQPRHAGRDGGGTLVMAPQMLRATCVMMSPRHKRSAANAWLHA